MYFFLIILLESIDPLISAATFLCFIDINPQRKQALSFLFNGRISWDSQEFDFIHTCFMEKGNGNPLQHSCLENPMDGGAW